jgi:hypothetical protein
MRVRITLLFITAMMGGQLWHPGPASAETRIDFCGGILHRDREGLRFGGGRGFDETVCYVKKVDERKVLAQCAVGRYCKVKGTVAACQDSGECLEISNITFVTTR